MEIFLSIVTTEMGWEAGVTARGIVGKGRMDEEERRGWEREGVSRRGREREGVGNHGLLLNLLGGKKSIIHCAGPQKVVF
jgi:hypothetical protein